MVGTGHDSGVPAGFIEGCNQFHRSGHERVAHGVFKTFQGVGNGLTASSVFGEIHLEDVSQGLAFHAVCKVGHVGHELASEAVPKLCVLALCVDQDTVEVEEGGSCPPKVRVLIVCVHHCCS